MAGIRKSGKVRKSQSGASGAKSAVKNSMPGKEMDFPIRVPGK